VDIHPKIGGVMVVKREEAVDRLVRLMGNGNVKVITGDYQDPWKDENGVVHVGVIPFLLNKKLIEK
jgi:hypothetical protein